MILDERLSVFLNSFDKGNSEPLEAVAREALACDVPIIRQDMQNFMRFLMELVKPSDILEIGAAVGFSASLMAENTPDATRITTIENWPPRITKCHENLDKLGWSDKVTLLEGDAAEIAPELLSKGMKYDFIFMDAAKGQYPMLLPVVIDMLKTGGLLVTDNVLSDGEILESKYALPRRQRTIHKRMREYLEMLNNSPLLTTSILAVGDGVALSVKKD